jgi:hypothetical protein
MIYVLSILFPIFLSLVATALRLALSVPRLLSPALLRVNSAAYIPALLGSQMEHFRDSLLTAVCALHEDSITAVILIISDSGQTL